MNRIEISDKQNKKNKNYNKKSFKTQHNKDIH